MSGFLQDKVVAITGGGRGIGRSIALDCAAAGAPRSSSPTTASRRTAPSPSSEVADGVVKEIEAAGGSAVALGGDVSTMAGGGAVVEAALDNWGRIDGVVCVAGILRERMLFNMGEDEFDDVVRVHLKGTFTVYRAASAVMRKQEGGGSLIGFTSGVWALGSTAQANYAAAKGGIVSLTYAAALGLERYGVRANCIAPVARTRMSANVPMQLAENGEPEDVAPMAVYLLSDAAKGVTGQVYSVVGGKIAVWSQPKEVRAMYKDGPLDAGGDRRLARRHRRHREDAVPRQGRRDAGRRRGGRQAERVTTAAAPGAMDDLDDLADLDGRSVGARRRRLRPRAQMAGRSRRRRVRLVEGPRRPGRRGRRLRHPGRLGARARRGRMDRARLAHLARRARRVGRPADHLGRGVLPRRGARRGSTTWARTCSPRP